MSSCWGNIIMAKACSSSVPGEDWTGHFQPAACFLQPGRGPATILRARSAEDHDRFLRQAHLCTRFTAPSGRPAEIFCSIPPRARPAARSWLTRPVALPEYARPQDAQGGSRERSLPGDQFFNRSHHGSCGRRLHTTGRRKLSHSTATTIRLPCPCRSKSTVTS